MTPERWQEIERLYHATAEQDADGRSAFLAAACQGDEDLRCEVESLLNHRVQAQDFIEAPAGGDLRIPIAAVLRQHDVFVPGRCVGRMLGVYKLQSWIASGGMGDVYRAIDTRLNRTVAVKILPEHLSTDPDRRQRFSREAKVISSLNHPHICTLYDIGVHDGVDYLVMEYIDGETLQRRLTRGALSLTLALEYALQIADAMDKAHRLGIVHRDLKPANIMLTASGVKVLDFGLATRLTRGSTDVADQKAENWAGLTRESTVMGTPEYSSPEQLEGKPVDARTDIFSFGATVYEMLTARRAFPAESAANPFSAIVREEPRSIRELAPHVPPLLERTLSRCLSNDPDNRWQTSNDLLFQLRTIAPAALSDSIPPPGPIRVPRRIERLLWVAALLAVIVGALVWTNGRPLPPAAQETPDIRVSLYASPGTDFHSGYDVPFALSPDGRRIAYVAVRSDGTKQLWLRSLSSETEQAEALQGTQGANTPFWAPDSQWIGFFAGRTLKKVRVSTGVVQLVASNVSTMGGAAWSTGDVIVFPAAPGGLFRVAARGGQIAPMTEAEGTQFWPQFLQDGKHFLYAVAVPGEVRIGSLEGKASRVLMKFAVRISSLAYVPGYLLFVQDATLFARPLDENRLEFSGEAVRLTERIPVTPPGRAPFSVSASGLLAYWSYTGGTPSVLQWFDRDGRTLTAIDKSAKYVGFALSPDSNRVVFSRRVQDGGADLWVRDLSHGTEAQLTFDKAAYTPQWSPYGTRVVFTGPGKGPPPKLFVKSLTGASTETPVGSWPLANFASGWSSDGNSIISVRFDRTNRNDLWVQRLQDGAEERLPVNSASNESDGKLSPDAQWLAYVTDESGRDEVWVASFPDGKIRRQVSFAGGISPQWGPNSREIFYVSDDKRVMLAALRLGRSGLELGTSRPLFSVPNIVEADQLLMPTSNSFAASSNGQRFLVAVRAQDPNTPPIRILANWRTLLRR